MNEVGIQRFGSLVIDRIAREVSVDDQPVHLTNTEYGILTTLAEHPRRAFSSGHLLQVVTGSSWSDGGHALQVSVSRLRAKLGESGAQPRLIVTVHGFGYRFDPQNTEPGSPIDVSALLLVAIDRSILWADANFAQLTGWQSGAIIGTSLYALIHDDDRPHAMAAKTELDVGQATTLMIRMRTATGDFILVEAHARPLIDSDGRTVCFLGEYRPWSTEPGRHSVTPEPIYVSSPTPFDDVSH